MTPTICYKDFLQKATDKEQARKLLKNLILQAGLNVSQASRTLKCCRETIRNLLHSEDLDFEKRKAPQNPPHKLKDVIEDAIVEYRRKTGYGPDMIKVNLNLKQSTSTIYAVLKRSGISTETKRSFRQKRIVKSIKKRLKAFEKWQLDTKYLDDIPNIVGPVIQGVIPRYEYTLRDMVTGTTFLGYANKERSVLASCTFVATALYHMQLHGIDTHYVTIQSDNGSEFIGGISKRDTYTISGLIEKTFGGKFQTIPVRRPTFNSHVESFHGRIEVEFYNRITNPRGFIKKAQGFQDYWNTSRKALKHKKTARRIASEYGKILPECFYKFPVLVYDLIPASILSTGSYPPDDLKLRS